MENFDVIILDFDKVTMFGQGFAEEIFKHNVYKCTLLFCFTNANILHEYLHKNYRKFPVNNDNEKPHNTYKEEYIARIRRGLEWHNKRNMCCHLTDKYIDNLEKMFLNVLKKEKQFEENYYQFITGVPTYMYFLQVVLNSIYSYPKTTKRQDFHFLRGNIPLPKNVSEFFYQHPDLNDPCIIEKIQELNSQYLDEDDEDIITDEWPEDTTLGYENDTSPEISTKLISASFSLETCASLDSALHVFCIW